MKLDKGGDHHPRRPHLHPGTGDRIQHPRGNHHDLARRHFDMDDPTMSPLLARVLPETAAVEGMKAIVYLDHLPDMGRMTLR